MNFTIDRSDMLAFTREFYSNSPTTRKAILKSQFVFPILMVAMASLTYYRNGGYSPMIFIVFGILWAVFYPTRVRRHMERTSERIMNESSHTKSLGSYSLRLDDAGIHSESPIGKSQFYWNAVDRVTLTESHLNIFLSGPIGFPIPKRQVDESLLRSAKQYIEEHTNTTEQGAAANP